MVSESNTMESNPNYNPDSYYGSESINYQQASLHGSPYTINQAIPPPMIPVASYELYGNMMGGNPMTFTGLPEQFENMNLQGGDSKPQEISNITLKASQSNLSADAAEFVPRWLQNPSNQSHSQNGAVSLMDAHFTNPAVKQLQSALKSLTVNPGDFDKLIPSLVEALKGWITDDDVLKTSVSLIFEQATKEANFRYNGARLSAALSSYLKESEEKDVFKESILKKCEEEHTIREETLRNNVVKLRGLTYFLAELFVHLKTGMGDQIKRVDRLREEIMDLFFTLLTAPSDDNSKCVCQVLKLAGSRLEDDERKSNEGGKTPTMDRLIVELIERSKAPNLTKLYSQMMLNVVELHKIDWGRKIPSPVVSHEPVADVPLGPVFYGPDGQIISPEERHFLESHEIQDFGDDDGFESSEFGLTWSPEDGMDEEMLKDYDRFLEAQCKD